MIRIATLTNKTLCWTTPTIPVCTNIGILCVQISSNVSVIACITGSVAENFASQLQNALTYNSAWKTHHTCNLLKCHPRSHFGQVPVAASRVTLKLGQRDCFTSINYVPLSKTKLPVASASLLSLLDSSLAASLLSMSNLVLVGKQSEKLTYLAGILPRCYSVGVIACQGTFVD